MQHFLCILYMYVCVYNKCIVNIILKQYYFTLFKIIIAYFR